MEWEISVEEAAKAVADVLVSAVAAGIKVSIDCDGDIAFERRAGAIRIEHWIDMKKVREGREDVLEG